MRTVNNKIIFDDEIAGLNVVNDCVIMREKSGIEVSIPIAHIVRMLDVYKFDVEHNLDGVHNSYDAFLNKYFSKVYFEKKL